MDNLELAMMEEYFTLVDNKDKPSIILFGRSSKSSTFKDGVEKINYNWCIGQTWADGENFSMHHINSYDKLKLWINQNTTGGYKYYYDLYSERLREK